MADRRVAAVCTITCSAAAAAATATAEGQPLRDEVIVDQIKHAAREEIDRHVQIACIVGAAYKSRVCETKLGHAAHGRRQYASLNVAKGSERSLRSWSVALVGVEEPASTTCQPCCAWTDAEAAAARSPTEHT